MNNAKECISPKKSIEFVTGSGNRHMIERADIAPVTDDDRILSKDKRRGRILLLKQGGTKMTDVIPIETIVSKIIWLRGDKVLLDRDLAVLYGGGHKGIEAGR